MIWKTEKGVRSEKNQKIVDVNNQVKGESA